MQTIPYMGSKKKLLSFLESSLDSYYANNNLTKPQVFFDAFAGSGRVSHHFASEYTMISNDKQFYSKIILEAYLQNTRPMSFYEPIVKMLNNLPESEWANTDGWYMKTYGTSNINGSSIGLDGKPKPWTDYNAKKIDIIRSKIDELYPNHCVEKSVLLLTLMLAVSKVSNWMGHQAGYFKEFKGGSLNVLNLAMLDLPVHKNSGHQIYCDDFQNVFPLVESDITYIDPPYGSNNKKLSKTGTTRYATFYHMWNTLMRNDKPDVWGKGNKRSDVEGYCDTLEFNDTSIVYPAFVKMLSSINSPVIMFSYSNKGLLTLEELKSCITQAGYEKNSIEVFTIGHASNSQKTAGRTKGHCIDRDNDSDPLLEYAILAMR